VAGESVTWRDLRNIITSIVKQKMVGKHHLVTQQNIEKVSA
jgi:hypothetical protein